MRIIALHRPTSSSPFPFQSPLLSSQWLLSSKTVLSPPPPLASLASFPRDQPEGRLFFACGQSLLPLIGLFWLRATANHATPWIVPVLACGCLTLGILSVYLVVFNCLADTYHTYANSAIAAQSFTQNDFAACLPLATEPMFDALGFFWRWMPFGRYWLALPLCSLGSDVKRPPD